MRAGKYPAEIKKDYDAIKKAPPATRPALRFEFITNVLNVTDGAYDSPYFRSRREIVSEEYAKGTREWISWKKYCDNEGEQVALHHVKVGSCYRDLLFIKKGGVEVGVVVSV